MKVIKIVRCDECPHYSFYDGWNGHDNVDVCEDRDAIIENTDIIDSGCILEDQK